MAYYESLRAQGIIIYSEDEDSDYEHFDTRGEINRNILHLTDNSSTLDVENIYKLLPDQSNRDVMLAGFFHLIYNWRGTRLRRLARRWRGRERGRGGEKREWESPNAIASQELLCALSWYLPLHPWNKIYISSGYMHLYFTPSSPPILVHFGDDYSNYHHANNILRSCCSHIKRICAFDNPRVIGAYILMVARGLQQQRDVVLGKNKKKTVPEFDKLKKSLFTSWSCPVKQVSLLFMREMGEVNVSQSLIANVLRCKISRKIYKLMN